MLALAGSSIPKVRSPSPLLPFLFPHLTRPLPLSLSFSFPGFSELVEQVERDPTLVSVATNDDILAVWDAVLSPMVRAWYGAKWSVKGWWERRGL